MTKKEQLYEGKAKKVFATDDPELLIVSYKDDATAFNGLKKGTIVGKGIINNRMSNLLMQRLEKIGIPTHYVEELSERETLVKKVSIVIAVSACLGLTLMPARMLYTPRIPMISLLVLFISGVERLKRKLKATVSPPVLICR